MIAYEKTTLNNYEVWVTNEHGKEPLGKLKRDSHDQWYYEPLAGSYMYIGALLHIVMKLDELNATAAEADPEAKQAAEGQSKFEVI
jgi:hypothetical protein